MGVHYRKARLQQKRAQLPLARGSPLRVIPGPSDIEGHGGTGVGLYSLPVAPPPPAPVARRCELALAHRISKDTAGRFLPLMLLTMRATRWFLDSPAVATRLVAWALIVCAILRLNSVLRPIGRSADRKSTRLNS